MKYQLTNRSSKLDAIKAINDVARAETMFTPISCRQRKPSEPKFIPDWSPDSVQINKFSTILTHRLDPALLICTTIP